MSMRIGYGFDSHEFKPGVTLKIGGVPLPHSSGLSGHSDGDVLLHAITEWKGADSAVFLREALKRVKSAGFAIANVDSTLVLAAPKIGSHSAAIRERVAELLGIAGDCVGLKAKTPEGLGTDNAAIAYAVVLLEKM